DTLRRLRPCRSSGNPTHPDPDAGMSPPPTRCTPDILIPPGSWDHDSFFNTAPHDARHAPPRCWLAPRPIRTRTETTTPLDAATPGTSPQSRRSCTLPRANTARMAKKVLLYSDQGGLFTNLHSTIPSACSPRRPFLLGLILAFHEVYQPEIVRD